MTSEKQAVQQDRYEKYANNACLNKVESHREFSYHVAEFIPDYADSSNGYDIIAVCTYPPKFFYKRILDYLKNKSKADISIEEAKKAVEDMDMLEKCIPISHAYLPEDSEGYESHPFIKKAKNIFIDTAEDVFPHFMAMQKIKPDRLIRLCAYRHMPGSKKSKKVFNDKMTELKTYQTKKYFGCIEDGFELFADYAFFRWLNGACPCYVLQPYNWKQWGLYPDYLRDFAVFGEKALVEYYADHKVMIHVEPLNKLWPFIKWSVLKVQIENEAYKNTWEPFSFLKDMYSVKKPQGIKEKLYSFGGNLKRLVEGANDSEVTDIRMKVHSAFIKCIERENDEDKLSQIYQSLPVPDKAKTSLDKLSKFYHKSSNRKELLEKIMEIIR